MCNAVLRGEGLGEYFQLLCSEEEGGIDTRHGIFLSLLQHPINSLYFLIRHMPLDSAVVIYHGCESNEIARHQTAFDLTPSVIVLAST